MNWDRNKSVILIDIDGLRRDLLYNSLAQDSLKPPSKKEMPNLNRIVGNFKLDDISDPDAIQIDGDYSVTFCESLTADCCVTVFPSYTYTTQASIFTGLKPYNHGITANFHFDRGAWSPAAKKNPENFSKYEGLKFYVGAGSGNRMMKKGVYTVYDHLQESKFKSAVTYMYFVSQNSNSVDTVIFDLPWRFEGGGEEIDWIVPNVTNQLQYALEGPADGISSYRDNFDCEMIEDALSYLSDFIRRKVIPPNFLTLYFGGHDHNAHMVKDGIKAQKKYLSKTVDFQLGKFLKSWEKLPDRKGLKNTLFIICADHGHTDVTLDDSKRITRKEIKGVLKKLGYDVLGKGEMFELEKYCDTVITTTAGVAHIYIKNGAPGGPYLDWCQNPSFENLKIILKSFFLANQTPNSPTNPFYNAFDYILFKDHSHGCYMIYEYDSSTDQDVKKPLPNNFGQSRGYVLGKKRLEELYCVNSGDILLLPNCKEDFRFEKSSRTMSTHGSLIATDSNVPLIFSTPYRKNLI